MGSNGGQGRPEPMLADDRGRSLSWAYAPALLARQVKIDRQCMGQPDTPADHDHCTERHQRRFGGLESFGELDHSAALAAAPFKILTALFQIVAIPHYRQVSRSI